MTTPREAYQEARAKALVAYDKAVALAKEAYDKAWAEAWEAYHKAEEVNYRRQGIVPSEQERRLEPNHSTSRKERDGFD